MTTRIEDRLIEWALAKEQSPHDPSWQSESLTHRLMVLGPEGMLSKSGLPSDGGLYNACRTMRRSIKLRGRAHDVSRIVKRAERIKPDAYWVITAAFLMKPGRITPSRMAAESLEISPTLYRQKYGEALSFVEGALLAFAA